MLWKALCAFTFQVFKVFKVFCESPYFPNLVFKIISIIPMRCHMFLRESLPKGMVHMDKILSEHRDKYALPKAAADDLLSTCQLAFATQYELYEHFKEERLPLFGLTSKCHSMAHCCIQSRYSEGTDVKSL